MITPKPLSWYPKPKDDTGFCMHFSPGNLMPVGRPEDVDKWLDEAAAMGAKAAKILVDQGKSADLVRKIVAHGMEPIIRFYCGEQWPDAMVDRCPELGAWVAAYVAAGAHYFETGNEPNLKSEWRGGLSDTSVWDQGAQVDRVCQAWVRDAEVVWANGGIPGLPALAPGGHYNDVDWFRTECAWLKEHGYGEAMAQGCVIYIHNGTLSHPLDYPLDEVNQKGKQLTQEEYDAFPEWAGSREQVNAWRLADKNPGQTLLSVDENGKDTGGSNCWDKPFAYHDIFVAAFGYELPIVGTEGGVWVGTRINDEWGTRIWDRRYPAVTQQQQAEWLVAIFQKVNKGGVPNWLFWWCEWCIGNMDLENAYRGFENDTLFSVRAWGGSVLAVEALKAMPKQPRVAYTGQPTVSLDPPPPNVLTDVEVARLLREMGFAGAGLVKMLAIIIAESGCDASAYNPNNPDGSPDRGIVQIHESAHPDVQPPTKAYDPVFACAYAYELSHGGEYFGHWCTYTQGTYLAYMERAERAYSALLPTAEELRKFTWEKCIGVPEDAALMKRGRELGLVPVCGEGRGSINGESYVGQVFVGDGGRMVLVYCLDGQWDPVYTQEL